jgi:hypothetical protein
MAEYDGFLDPSGARISRLVQLVQPVQRTVYNMLVERNQDGISMPTMKNCGSINLLRPVTGNPFRLFDSKYAISTPIARRVITAIMVTISRSLNVPGVWSYK